jgi:hypothetical protein
MKVVLVKLYDHGYYKSEMNNGFGAWLKIEKPVSSNGFAIKKLLLFMPVLFV